MENSIVIIGVGRIGSKIAEKLSKYHKNILLIDRDTIEKSNIETGYKFTIECLNKPKAIFIKEELNLSNAIVEDLSSDNINIIKNFKLIIDGTDNFETRFLINDFAVKHSMPYIFASVIQNKGMVFPILPNKPCLRCLFNNPKNFESCETLGVELNIVEKVTDKQLSLALEILNNKNFTPELLHFKDNKENKIKVNKKSNCPCCSKRNFEFLNSKPLTQIIKFCGSGNYMIKGEFDFNKLKENLKDEIKDFGTAFNYKGIMIYKNKVMLKADSKPKAKNLYLNLMGNLDG